MVNKNTIIIALLLIVLLVVVVIQPEQETNNLKRFNTGKELLDVFNNLESNNYAVEEASIATTGAVDSVASRDYSETNIQVAGVDEADIVKTDGEYIYYVSNQKLTISKAYPEDDAEVLTVKAFSNFMPNEIFIHKDKLVVFGYSNYNHNKEEFNNRIAADSLIYPYYNSVLSVRIYDISDKEDIKLEKIFDFEGNYLTSRKIDDVVYIVSNNYPYVFEPLVCDDVIPMYRESFEEDSEKEFSGLVNCNEIGYIDPIQDRQFITIASINIEDLELLDEEVILGSGDNVYVSKDNLYIAKTNYPNYRILEDSQDYNEETNVVKFNLNDGKIDYKGSNNIPGHVLNQFSMDEYKDNLRIATTKSNFNNEKSSNNIYVLNEDLKLIGSLENLAPGENIFSARFIEGRAYLVTFKKIDPLFVIDLNDPSNPNVLGKLKIPGYSDYLHPYDENHIIGIGKDTVEASGELVEERSLDFAWYQGIKIAIFDVSDVENPIELHKEIIGDRGTDSPALYNHKAFLFDKSRELLVLPILLAEFSSEPKNDWEFGDYTFQGAYVYNVNLDDGFNLKGKITHYDDEVITNSGYYWYGEYDVQRALFIEDILYTISGGRIKLNHLDSLEEVGVLNF